MSRPGDARLSWAGHLPRSAGRDRPPPMPRRTRGLRPAGRAGSGPALHAAPVPHQYGQASAVERSEGVLVRAVVTQIGYGGSRTPLPAKMDPALPYPCRARAARNSRPCSNPSSTSPARAARGRQALKGLGPERRLRPNRQPSPVERQATVLGLRLRAEPSDLASTTSPLPPAHRRGRRQGEGLVRRPWRPGAPSHERPRLRETDGVRSSGADESTALPADHHEPGVRVFCRAG